MDIERSQGQPPRKWLAVGRAASGGCGWHSFYLFI